MSRSIVVESRDPEAIRAALLKAVRPSRLEAVQERWRGPSRDVVFAFGSPEEAADGSFPFTRGRAVRRARRVELAICTRWNDYGAVIGELCAATEREVVDL